jgi:hypothetical protein
VRAKDASDASTHARGRANASSARGTQRATRRDARCMREWRAGDCGVLLSRVESYVWNFNA